MDKDPGIYVRHILDAITNIEMDTAGYDFEKFRKDRRARQLVERNLEILSEATAVSLKSSRTSRRTSPGEQSPASATFYGTITMRPIRPFSGIPVTRI
jgi:uncharacterized protein with HEPN domain